MAKKKDAEQGQQMRIQQDGSIIPETPELLTSEEDDAVRKEKLAKASDEVLELMKRNSDKGWIELFLIVDKVEEEQLYLPEYKSITAWGQALADRGGFRLRELWRRKRAGSAYREYEKLKEARGKTVHHLEELAETTGMTPRNIETITKIAGGNKRIKEKLLDQLSTEKIGQDQLDAMWDAAKAAGIQPKKSRHQKDVEDEELLELLRQEELLRQFRVLTMESGCQRNTRSARGSRTSIKPIRKCRCIMAQPIIQKELM